MLFHRKPLFWALLGFLVCLLVIGFIQYNATNDVHVLVQGNTRLLDELQVRSDLTAIQQSMSSLQENLVNLFETGDTLFAEKIRLNKQQIAFSKKDLLTHKRDLQLPLDTLNFYIDEKMDLIQDIEFVYHHKGKQAALDKIDAYPAIWLSAGIDNAVQEIELNRTLFLTKETNLLDRSAERFQLYTYGLIGVVAILSVLLFIYISKLITRIIISERKVLESSKLKEKFMANMSHEIRTPMNSILGFTNLLKRERLDTKAMTFVDAIEKSGENLLHIINDILDLSKIEAGMMRIEQAPFSIRGLLVSLKVMFIQKLREKNLVLHYHVNDQVPDMLRGDATRLMQVLVNLVNNAIKFTPSGRIHIVVDGEPQGSQHILLRMAIQDSGIGIAPEKLSQVFNRFEQAEDSYTRKYGGTGLGLAIVKEIVELQQGHINVESTPGKGSCFTIELPMQIHTHETSGEDVLSTPHFSGKQEEGIHLLVAEDNTMNQTLLRFMLEDRGYSFDMVNNGLEAIEMLTQKSYNLILMDIQMPVMDGYSATEHIRNQMQLDIPIIAMTAHAFEGERDKCLERGMNDYIAKPLQENLLFELIQTYTSPIRKQV